MSFGWLKPEISIGEIVLALATVGAAWYVGSALKRKQDRDLATRDLVRFFCRESLQLLAAVSDAFIAEFVRTDGVFDLTGINNIKTALQRLSNSLHTISISIARGRLRESKSLTKQDGQLNRVLAANDALRSEILNPLVDQTSPGLKARQIEGAISQMREAIVGLELDIVSHLE